MPETEPMPLPAPTRDLRQARADLDRHGLCQIPEVLSRDTCAKARQILYAAAAQDRTSPQQAPDFPLDVDANNQRVWNLLARDPLFSALAEHSTALELVRHLLGWPALLSNISANIAYPNTAAGVMHADQGFVAQPWPARPQGLNVAWCVDDFSAANGATLVAPAGSILVFESRLWHQSGANTTTDESRAGVFAFYTTPAYRTQENWFLTLDEAFLRTASPTLLTLLAYKAQGFGLVYGRSPR